MSKADSGRFDGTRGSRDDGYRRVHGFTTKVHEGKQGKHIPGHHNYERGKSVIRGGISAAEILILEAAGTGEWHGTNREVVEFDHRIGTYVDPRTGAREPTNRGTIHYSKLGAHIVPARPKKRGKES